MTKQCSRCIHDQLTKQKNHSKTKIILIPTKQITRFRRQRQAIGRARLSMSADTLTTTDMVVKDDLNSSLTNNQQTESSVNGILHTDNKDINETSVEEQNESIENTYNENQQTPSSSPNKNDLEPEALRKVFIGGLSYKTEDQTFRDYFSKFGEIDDCIIMRDRENRSRGFGFVTYLSSTMVDKLMAARPHVLDSREIEPKRAIPKEESGKPESALSAKKLFVGGIREGTINEDDLKEYFSKYGHIVQTVIMKTNEGKFRGFGFVEFNDYDPVDKIVLEKHHVIKGNPVNVEKALPKEQTNRGRMGQSHYGGPGGSGGGGGMRGPSSRMSGSSGAGGGGGWGPMSGGSNFGGGSGGYRSVGGGGGGGYGTGGDYTNRPAPYGGGYGGDMGSGGMVGYGGGSAPMGGNGYGMDGSGGGNYNDSFGTFNQPSGFGFGESYGSSSGGPMRRGGGGRGGAPYGRGGGGGFRGRTQQ
ncbi:unnamed protein product [Rotaria sordida]|uniref:RRM domain-containing protein n=2 Tax=Rotaria sordida TaxID=392033 RepID=A0A815ISD3_9BILA|nr:unnamed protein product [Rotaria sordida]